RQAKNRELEADALEIRMRATRRLDQLRQAQKDTVGLNEGGRPSKTGLARNPVLPTLASQGIDKNLAHNARKLGSLSEDNFRRAGTEARSAPSVRQEGPARVCQEGAPRRVEGADPRAEPREPPADVGPPVSGHPRRSALELPSSQRARQ